MSAVAVNFVNFETELRGIFPTDRLEPLRYGPPATSLVDILASPVLGQWRMLLRDPIANSDLAWLRTNGVVLWPVVLVGFTSTLIAAALLVRWWHGVDRKRLAHAQIMTWLPLALALTVMLVWTSQVSSDPRYGTAGEGYRAILDKIRQESSAEDAVVTVTPYHYTIPMNWFQSALPLYGYAPDSLAHAESKMLLTSVVAEHPRIWFVTAGLPPADPNNSVERWLAAAGYKADDQWYGDFRLVRYATAAHTADFREIPLDTRLKDDGNLIELVNAWAGADAQSGETFPVEITFRMKETSGANLRWFVQVLNAVGEPVAMTDTASQGGYRSFGDLTLGEEYSERLGLQMPRPLPAGHYQLIAGVYNPDRAGARLITPTGEDYVTLAQVTVP